LLKNSLCEFVNNPSSNFSSRGRDVFARFFAGNRTEKRQKPKFSRKFGGFPSAEFSGLFKKLTFQTAPFI
jgi:hypothetical protein